MLKILGAVLILGAGCVGCGGCIYNQRRQLRGLLDVIDALGQIEGEIRWKNARLPQAIRLQTERTYVGGEFLALLKYMESGKTLQESWCSVFGFFRPGQAAEVICRISLFGDAQQIMQSLCYGREQLREIYHQLRQEQKNREKLYVTSSVSATALLVILLF